MTRLTDFLAVYAAALSTLVFIWNILGARPRVRLRILPGVQGDDDSAQMGVYISVQNTSAHTVHLQSLSILYPYTDASTMEKFRHVLKFRRLPWSVGWVHTSLAYKRVEDGFPVSVEGRKSHDVFIPQPVLEDIFEDATKRKIKAAVQDALWRSTYSKAFEVDWYIDSADDAPT